jgi:DNA polymerase-3 subunit beta
VRELPEAEIQLTQKEENLEIRSGRSLFRLRSLSPDEFPKIPQIQTEETVRLPARILKEMISRVSISISSDEARYTLTGVLTQMEEKQGVGLFRMVTTDGHRLSYCERTVPDGSRISGFQCVAGKGEKRDVILPRKAVQEMGRLAEEADEKQELEFGVFQENAFVRKDQFSMVMRLVQGKFPDHQAVIPSQIESSLTVSSQRLEEALRRVSLLSTEKTKGIRLSMDANRMVISSNSPEIGEAQEEIDISFQGEPFDVSFNVRYLLDLVQIIHSEISMEFGPGHRPCVIKELSDPQHLYVVMPLRT